MNAKELELVGLVNKALSTGQPCGESLVEQMVRALESLGFRWKHLPPINTPAQMMSGELPAVVEPLMNSIDAVCRLKATERAIETGRPTSGPEFDGMFKSQRHLTEELFGVPNGELALWRRNARGRSYAWLASRVASLILEFGDDMDKQKPTVKIIDRGCGQSSRRFRGTFLAVGVGDKGARLWESGTYGIGGAVLARIGRYQIILSREPGGVWGLLVIRSEKLTDEAHDFRVLSVMARGADGAPDEFPTLHPGAELREEQSYAVIDLDHRPDAGEVADIVLEKAASFEASRGEAEEVRAEFLTPPNKGYAASVRVIASRRLMHGTARIVVGTNFGETWIGASIAGRDGIRRTLETAVPNPVLPYFLVENRYAAGVPAINIDKSPCEPVLGRTHALSDYQPLEPFHVDVDIDGPMGTVEVSLYYDGGSGTASSFSESLSKFAKHPHLIRSGQLVEGGDGNEHEFTSMLGNGGFTRHFACLASLDGLRNDCDRLPKVCTAGRQAGAPRYIRSLWKQVAAAVACNPQVREVVEGLRLAMPEPDEYAKQLSRVLGGKGGAGAILPGGSLRVPVCVRGDDMPSTGASPDYVCVDYEPRFSSERRSLETLKPVRVKAGKTKSFRIRTSAGRINFARKGGPYTLKVHADGPGIDARAAGNRLVVTAARVRRTPTTLYVYAVNDSGFVSTPGVLKVLPVAGRRPAPAAALLPKPTFVRVGTRRLELPVGAAKEIRLRTDADPSFRGFSGEATHGGRARPVRVRPDGRGRLRALVPALRDARAGDTCLLGVSANGVAMCSVGLTVVDRPAPPPPPPPRARNPLSTIDAPGDPAGPLLAFADEKDPPEAWNFKDTKSPGQICVRDGKRWGVQNRLSPIFVESAKQVKQEAARASDGSERERLEGLVDDYICRMFVTLGDQLIDTEGSDDYVERSSAACWAVARVLPLTTHVDISSYHRRYPPESAAPGGGPA